MEKQKRIKLRIRVYKYKKGTNTPVFRKALSLPLFLYRQDDFAMLIAQKCGCHSFHVNYSGSEDKTRRLCDIKINRLGSKQVEYLIPHEEDRHRLFLLLQQNRKRRHLMKETTEAGKAPQHKEMPRDNDSGYMYG